MFVCRNKECAICFFIPHIYIELVEAAKGVSLSLDDIKYNYSRMADKKSSIAIFDYQSLEAATNSFSKSHILCEIGSRIVYRARFDEHLQAAVKKGNTDADKEFEVMVHLK